MFRRLLPALILCLMGALVAPAPTAHAAADSLTVYSGRSKSLVEPLFERFTKETGIRIVARYADTTDLATLLLEEGQRSPADVFFAQDPGALGAVSDAGLLAELPSEIVERVGEGHRSKDGDWVATSGRARTIVHSADADPASLPKDVFDLTQPRYRGRVGWAPTNASFQMFVTAMQATHGDEKTAQWLRDMKANGVRDYPKNRPIVQAVADGEIDFGLVNHYYLVQFKAQLGDDFPVEQYQPEGVGGMMSIAGAGVLRSSRSSDAAQRFIAFLLSDEAQRYFAEQTGEYPLVGKDTTAPADTDGVSIDLGSLSDRQGTLELLRQTGVLP